MKQIFLFIVVLSVCSKYAICQHSFGLKGGLNLSNQQKTVSNPQNPTTQTQNTKSFLGYQIGVFYKAKLKSNWVFSTEANFSVIGSRTQYVTEEQILYPDGIKHYYHDKISYIEIPLILQFNLNKFFVGAGPGLSLKVFSKITKFENRSYNTSYFKTFDAAGNFLAGYNILKHLDVNLRYSYGLLNIYEEHAFIKMKNRFINLSVLYSLK